MSESGERIQLNFAHFLKGTKREGRRGATRPRATLPLETRREGAVFCLPLTSAASAARPSRVRPSAPIPREWPRSSISYRSGGVGVMAEEGEGEGERERERIDGSGGKWLSEGEEASGRGRDRRAAKKANCSNRFNGRAFAALPLASG